MIILACCLLPLLGTAGVQEPAEPDSTAPQKGVQAGGLVLDAASESPVSGAAVSVPGFSSELSDDQGRFSLPVPGPEATLRVEGEGYQVKEIALKGRTDLVIGLHEEGFPTFYREARLSRDLAAGSRIPWSVVSDAPQHTWQDPQPAPENHFQARLPGLNLVRRSGTPGIGADMYLRGITTLYATSQPLVVVDGMIYDLNDYGGSLVHGHFSNPLAYIDVRDIEEISLIRDGASEYGAKAASGVLMIRTSHAEDVTTRIDFGAYSGINQAPSDLPVMQAGDYRTYLSDLLKSRGDTDAEIRAQPYMNDNAGTSGYYNYHNNTNWQDQVLGSSYSTNYYLKVSGGDNIARYALSAGYLNQEGIVGNSDYTRYNMRFNGDLFISPRFTIAANLAFSYGENDLVDQGPVPKTNPLYQGLVKAPFLAPNVMADDGSMSPNLADADLFDISNPLAIINSMEAGNKNYRFFGSMDFGYELARDLELNVLLGLTNDKIRENVFVPRLGVVDDTLSNAIAESRMQYQVQRLLAVYTDSRISFSRELSAGQYLAARAGMRFQRGRSEEDYGLGFNSATDDLTTIGTGVNALRQTGGQLGEWLWMSYYAGADYRLKDRYLFSVQAALDGSSRFGPEGEQGIGLFGTRFGLFPSVAAGWLLSSERFMAGWEKLDLLKLRLSYGITGNDGIGNYQTRNLYRSQNLLGIQGLVRSTAGNPALQWETSRKLNAGLDLALFNERLTARVDVYRNITGNMLLYEPAPHASGLDLVPTNNGKMQTRGIDFSLFGRVLSLGPGLTWDLSLNLSHYRNEVTGLGAGGDILTQVAGATVLTRTGLPAGVFYGYKAEGVYTSDAEAAAAGLGILLPDNSRVNFRGGDVRFADQDGDGIIGPDDRVVIGDPNPDLTGGLGSSWQYKRWSLQAWFTFSMGNDVYNHTRAQLESMSGYANQTVKANARWRSDGQETDMPRAAWGDPLGNARFSDRWIEDGSYLRLSMLSLAYELPIGGRFFRNTTVYLTGNNLFTLTRYLGYDPEFSYARSPLARGIDAGQVPQFRSFLLGVRVGL